MFITANSDVDHILRRKHLGISANSESRMGCIIVGWGWLEIAGNTRSLTVLTPLRKALAVGPWRRQLMLANCLTLLGVIQVLCVRADEAAVSYEREAQCLSQFHRVRDEIKVTEHAPIRHPHGIAGGAS